MDLLVPFVHTRWCSLYDQISWWLEVAMCLSVVGLYTLLLPEPKSVQYRGIEHIQEVINKHYELSCMSVSAAFDGLGVYDSVLYQGESKIL